MRRPKYLKLIDYIEKLGSSEEVNVHSIAEIRDILKSTKVPLVRAACIHELSMNGQFVDAGKYIKSSSDLVRLATVISEALRTGVVDSVVFDQVLSESYHYMPSRLLNLANDIESGSGPHNANIAAHLRNASVNSDFESQICRWVVWKQLLIPELHECRVTCGDDYAILCSRSCVGLVAIIVEDDWQEPMTKRLRESSMSGSFRTIMLSQVHNRKDGTLVSEYQLFCRDKRCYKVRCHNPVMDCKEGRSSRLVYQSIWRITNK